MAGKASCGNHAEQKHKMKTELIHGSPVRIYDNGGKTFDRYTAIYMEFPENKRGLFSARGMSEHPAHPQGFGQWCSAVPGRHLGKRIAFADLPEDCRKVIVSDITG